mgnify:CR=1 FL=1
MTIYRLILSNIFVPFLVLLSGCGSNAEQIVDLTTSVLLAAEFTIDNSGTQLSSYTIAYGSDLECGASIFSLYDSETEGETSGFNMTPQASLSDGKIVFDTIAYTNTEVTGMGAGERAPLNCSFGPVAISVNGLMVSIENPSPLYLIGGPTFLSDKPILIWSLSPVTYLTPASNETPVPLASEIDSLKIRTVIPP